MPKSREPWPATTGPAPQEPSEPRRALGTVLPSVFVDGVHPLYRLEVVQMHLFEGDVRVDVVDVTALADLDAALPRRGFVSGLGQICDANPITEPPRRRSPS